MPSYYLLRRFRARVFVIVFLIGCVLLAILHYVPFRGIHSGVPSFWWNPVVGPWACNLGGGGAEDYLDTGEVYPTLDFKLPDNGGTTYWNKEMEDRYRRGRASWKNLPLEVIIVPQSHVDPGWLRTYDDYYEYSVSRILNNMVEFLNKTETFKFIWSEISYFSKWWSRQSKDIQETVKKLLKRNQLEIVTGGWVMTDEATTHYFAIVDQLIEGHQWMMHHINITPQHAWSVDVFGHSASLPYILVNSGIEDMVILRAHYGWKSYLAKTQQFDFYWGQAFDSSRILCHMGPSDLYSFKHTCGPDPTVCLQYDFRHVHGERSESTAVDITDQNVEAKAEYLLSQYGRYASLFPHNVLLVPLGDDFRFNFYIEWVNQFENYQKIMDYINSRKDWNAHVRFGTVGDYFKEVNRRLQNNVTTSLSTIKGDFLPYADIYADYRASYWTGFYSTRPFYKKLSKELEHWLRTSEILYSLAKTILPYYCRKMFKDDYSSIVNARQNLALFQHHDAITGTSKAAVMTDYGQRLHSSIINSMSVASHIAQFLMIEKSSEENVTWTSKVYPDTYRATMGGLSQKLQISVFNRKRKIILFNSLTKVKSEIIRLRVKSPYLKVVKPGGESVPFQISPVINEEFAIASNLFEIIFVANIEPLSFMTYTLVKISKNETTFSSRSEISLFYDDDLNKRQSIFKFRQPYKKQITLESPKIRATFSNTGHLQHIFLKEQGVTKILNIDFRAYIPKKYQSGGYLFHPNDGKTLPINNLTDHYPLIFAIHGSLVSEVIFVNNPFLKFTVRMFNYEGAPTGLHMDVALDIAKVMRESEVVMQIKSDVRNQGVFYTDSNNLQMLKRTYASHLPVQGNYYPATSAVYIEDDEVRLTFLLPHSHGVSSVSEGTIEVMLDRMIINDDGRGMSEGVQDNHSFLTSYWLIPEALNSKSEELPCLSREAHLMSLFLLHPVVILLVENTETELRDKLEFLPDSWPVDTHLVNLRTLSSKEDYDLPSNDSLLVVCQKITSCRVSDFRYNIDSKDVNVTAFSQVQISAVVRTTLTGGTLSPKSNSRISDSTRLYTYKISFR